MPPTSNLFAIVHELLLDHTTAQPLDVADDEATFVKQLRTSAQRASQASGYVANVCKQCTPEGDAVTLTEAHLPLVARVIGVPIGVVGTGGGVVHVPHQWLPPATKADDDMLNDDMLNDDMLNNDAFDEDALLLDEGNIPTTPDDAYVLLRDTTTDSKHTTYSIATDDEHTATYVATYTSLASTHGWHIATDTVSLTLVPLSSVAAVRPNKSSSALASYSIARRWTSSTAWHTVITSLNVLHNQLAQRQLVDVWGNTYAFPSTSHAEGFPQVHDVRFAERLYRQCPEMQQALLGSGAVTCATYKAHQQVVRTFFSPLTPYRSLLLIHGTGTGKTFTALGLTASFREYTTQQHKRIHIGCPRNEVCDEFKSYLTLQDDEEYVSPEPSTVSADGAPPRTPKAYTQAILATDEQTTWHDESRPRPKRALQDVYNIQTHRSLFDERITSYTLVLQQVYTAWRWVLPTLNHVQRTPDGFELRAPLVGTFDDANVVKHVQSSLDNLSACAEQSLGERWTYGVRVGTCARSSRSSSNSGKTRGKHVIIHVSGTTSLDAYEAHIVQTYSETVMVIDEAHYVSDSPASGGGGGAAAPTPKTPQTSRVDPRTSWRIVLQMVIAVLRFHRTRMRLVLLTATPMTNSESDVYTLLNLMVHNDGFADERPFLNAKGVLPTNAHLHGSTHASKQLRAWRNSPQFVRCVQGRVSYFRSDEGKPTQLAADDVFYCVPLDVDATTLTCVSGRACAVLIVSDVANYVRLSSKACNTKDIPQCVWRTSSAATAATKAMHAHTSSVQHPNQQQYVYVVVERTTSEHALSALLRHVHPTRTTLVLLCADKARATQVANDTADTSLATRLFAHASARHPLLPTSHHTLTSAYHVRTQPPSVYAARVGNLPAFFARYLPHTAATAPVCATYAPSIVVTPMRNEALYPTTAPTRTLRYQFRGRQLQTFNVTAAAAKRVYQPKLDTMFAMMEALPGNMFIYTDEVRLDDTGSQTLQRLKQCIEARFRKQPHSRLSKVHVEILHKETLAKQLQQQHADNTSATDEDREQLQQRALNERINVLNRTLLRTRDDVVLLGAEEVKEGLTFNEIRQVHILSPAWNQASMEQVIGRAVRIGNHQKRADAALRSVACVLHVSVPEHPADTKLDTTTDTNPLTRVIGDLHRYDFVARKQAPIAQTMVKLRRYAWDAVLQDTSTRERQCVMADKPDRLWRLTKRYVMDERVSSVVQSMRRTLSSSSNESRPTTTADIHEHTEVYLPRETLRAEVDTLKHNVCQWFAHADTPFCTFDELRRKITPYYTPDTDVHAWLQQSGHVELPLVLDSPPDKAHTVQHLHNLVLTQYLWRVRPHPHSPDTHLALDVEPLSVLSHPDWLATLPKARTPPQTLVELRRRLSDTSGKRPVALLDVLDRLTTTYALARSAQHTSKAPPHVLHGVRLQLVTADALAYALDELIHHNTLIDRGEKGNSHVLRLRDGFYTVESVHMPPSVVYPPLCTSDITPYSVPLPTKRAMTTERVMELLATMHATATQLVACVKAFATKNAQRELLAVTYEHVFDRLSFVEQDALLDHFAKHGIHTSSSKQNELLRTAVRHRFIEKGARASDVFPAEAADVLNACFPEGAGRAYMRFSRTSAHEPCVPAWFVSPQTKGKQQAQLTTYVSMPTPARAVKAQTVSYFSPVPVVQHERTLLFASSVRVVHASLGKLASQLPAFGYNEVYNWKDRRAGYLHDPMLCADTRLQDDVKKTNSLLTDTARDILQELSNKLHPPTWTAPIADVERAVGDALHDNNVSNIDPAHYVRYVLLRRANAFQRFFYPGIVTKHPETHEFYASYRHKDDVKRERVFS